MTKIFAHRGSAGTHPENTLAAFQEAIRVGADGIEIDIQLTKDHELVVIHDHTLDRTTNGTGEVQSYTLAELKKFDAGSKFSPEFKEEKIPSFLEVLELIKGTNVELNVEIKNRAKHETGVEKKVVEDLEKAGLTNKIIISSFNHQTLKKVKELRPDLECAILYMKKMDTPWNYASQFGATALHTYEKETEIDMIHEAQEKGFPVRVFTVNDEEGMEKLIRAHVSAIITDYPEIALRKRAALLQ